MISALTFRRVQQRESTGNSGGGTGADGGAMKRLGFGTTVQLFIIDLQRMCKEEDSAEETTQL